MTDPEDPTAPVWLPLTDAQVLAEAREAIRTGDAAAMRHLAPVLAERLPRLEAEVLLLEAARDAEHLGSGTNELDGAPR